MKSGFITDHKRKYDLHYHALCLETVEISQYKWNLFSVKHGLFLRYVWIKSVVKSKFLSTHTMLLLSPTKFHFTMNIVCQPCLANKVCLTILLIWSRREFNIVYLFYCCKAHYLFRHRSVHQPYLPKIDPQNNMKAIRPSQLSILINPWLERLKHWYY